MSGPDPNDVARLFDLACDLPEDQRRGFLDQACADDPALRDEVASLLAHDRDLPDVLQTAGMPVHRAARTDPEWIGPFRVLERLAEGGMGVVYRGKQESPIQRVVALKLIRSGLASQEVIARFESERQALALMDHPNIARVIDAGTTEDGLPYFAMDHVAGEPITTYCERRKLSVDERLELFVQVCDGVQHAHRRAIIHRDIKPSNVLVTVRGGRAVPVIIDFGIAKALDRPLTGKKFSTALGQMIGTPEYMSPEQAEMTGENVDTRTDVYSLGALLYELLTGEPPFDPRLLRDASFDEIRRRIREDDPVRPSARAATPRARQLQGDLDAIVLKAIYKERELRYGSPSELAADVRRYLAREPVLAGSPGAGYHLGKFVRRHRIGVGFCATLLVLLIGFAVTMSLQAARVARQRDRANAALDLTIGMLESYQPSNVGRGDVATRAMLEESLAQIDSLGDEPLLQGRLLATIAAVYRRLGLIDDSRRLLERARPRLIDAVGATHADTLKATSSLATAYSRQRRFDEAERLFVEALDGQRRELGPRHANTLSTMLEFGILLSMRDELERAQQLYTEVVQATQSDDEGRHPTTLMAMNLLGMSYTSSGRYEDAEPLLVGALAGHRRELGDDHPRTMNCMNSVAVLFMYQGRHREAEALYEEALRSKRRVLGERHPSTLRTVYNFACLAALEGDRERAFELLGLAIESGYSSTRLLDDPDLVSLRGDPRFEALVAPLRDQS